MNSHTGSPSRAGGLDGETRKALLVRFQHLAEAWDLRGPNELEVRAAVTDLEAIASGVAVVYGGTEVEGGWSLRLYVAGDLVVERLPGGWSRLPEPPPPSRLPSEHRPDHSTRPPDPRVLSPLLAKAQARVLATGQPLSEEDLAGLVAQEPALAGATVECGAYGELAITLAGGGPWATLAPDARLDWVAPDVPDPKTPPPDSAAFAHGRQQFKATVALLARRERRLLDRPTRCRGARPRAVRFKPRSGARRAARRGATRAGPGDDAGSEGEGEPPGALPPLVGIGAVTSPSPAHQGPPRSYAQWRLQGRLSRAPTRGPRTGLSPFGGRS